MYVLGLDRQGEWEVDWTGSGSCPMAGFGIGGAEL
jgi:hypothetical protein